MPTFPPQPWTVTEVGEAVPGLRARVSRQLPSALNKNSGDQAGRRFWVFFLLRATFNELAFLKEPANIWSLAAGSPLPPGLALQGVGCLGELGPAPLFHPHFPLGV